MVEINIFRPGGPAASHACADILATLPGWFGQPGANAAYRRDIANKTTILATTGTRPLGLLSLEIHFDTTAEIWLMAVREGHHRQGIGKALMQRAEKEARQLGCRNIAVSTLSPRSPDPGYAATRAFYAAMGFEPFIEFNSSDPVNPRMWMIKTLFFNSR